MAGADGAYVNIPSTSVGVENGDLRISSQPLCFVVCVAASGDTARVMQLSYYHFSCKYLISLKVTYIELQRNNG